MLFFNSKKHSSENIFPYNNVKILLQNYRHDRQL